MARTIRYFVENKKISDLLNLFKVNQGSLFHYTKPHYASLIVENRELQITRADSFLDTEEVKYGTDILRESAKSLMSVKEVLLFEKILSQASYKMQYSYVFSTSQNGQNAYLKENYGVSILQFSEDFAMELLFQSEHNETSNGELRLLSRSNELYRCHEGHVVYDRNRQEVVAVAICRAFVDIFSTGLGVGDWHHFVDVVSKFVLLTKNLSYSREEEYRIILFLGNDKSNKFEHSSLLENGRERRYLKLSLDNEIKLKE